MYLSNITLTLLFTSNVSLNDWAKMGNLEREVEIYKHLQRYLKEVNFVTYGAKNDHAFAKQIEPIRLLPLKWYGPGKKTARRLILRYWPNLLRTHVFKTNQIKGSGVAIWLKKVLRKRLIVRCGYLHARFIELRSHEEQFIQSAYDLERRAFEEADIGVVTSERDKQWVIDKHKIAPEKIRVIPNYVNTEIFKPMPEIQKEFDLVCVAKADPVKNLDSLIDALSLLKIRGQKVRLMLIGGCSTDEALHRKIQEQSLDVTFKGNISNYELPYFLNKAKVFILPSHFEGHPKALLEAMSCGLSCIGTNVEGIRENIQHGETGYLCNTDPQGIARAIAAVLANKVLQQQMGKKARSHIKNNYSLDKILKMELEVLQSVVCAQL
jgi:glycosyltransferase involved in cell wall biosynthesis